MSGGFLDPIVGGQALRIPSIRSPNFLTGVSGWTINKDGSAEFNNGVFRGTVTAAAFIGTDFVINTQGQFFYSGPPALGNLILSIAPVAGVSDGFGNAFDAGLATYAGGVDTFHLDAATGTLRTGTAAAAHWQFDVPASQFSMFDINAALTARLSAAAGNSNFVWLSNAASQFFAITAGSLLIGRLTTPGALPTPQDQNDSAKLFLITGPPDTVNIVGPGRAADPGSVPVQIGLKSGNAGTTVPGGANNPVLQVQSFGTGVCDLELFGGALYRGDLSGWQTPSLGAGWSAGSIRSSLPLRYKIDGEDNLIVKGSVSCTTTTPAAVMFSVVAPYLPAGSYSLQQGVAIKQSAAGGSFAFGHGFITAGAVEVNGFTFTSGDIVSLDFSWPLGNLP